MKSESLVLRVVTVPLFFIVNLFAAYLFLRGHNLPGGGFIAGLVTAISLLLVNMAFGQERTRALLRFDPARIAACGLLVALCGGMWGIVKGGVFLDHSNWHLHGVPLLGEVHVGTPMIFDLGVYLVVVGIACKILFSFGQSVEGLRALVSEEERHYASPLEEPVESGDSAPGREP